MSTSKIYLDVSFSECGMTLGEQQIAEWKANIGVELPRDYYRFLLGVNGGVPNPSGFHVDEDFDDMEEVAMKPHGVSEPRWKALQEIESNVIFPDRIDRFESLEQLTRLDVVLTTDDNTSSLLPIGYDRSNNAIYMSLSTKRNGAIYWQDSVLVNETNFPTTSLSEFEDCHLASSFSQFINSLFSARIVTRSGFRIEDTHRAIIDFASCEDPVRSP